MLMSASLQRKSWLRLCRIRTFSWTFSRTFPLATTTRKLRLEKALPSILRLSSSTVVPYELCELYDWGKVPELYGTLQCDRTLFFRTNFLYWVTGSQFQHSNRHTPPWHIQRWHSELCRRAVKTDLIVYYGFCDVEQFLAAVSPDCCTRVQQQETIAMMECGLVTQHYYDVRSNGTMYNTVWQVQGDVVHRSNGTMYNTVW